MIIYFILLFIVILIAIISNYKYIKTGWVAYKFCIGFCLISAFIIIYGFLVSVDKVKDNSDKEIYICTNLSYSQINESKSIDQILEQKIRKTKKEIQDKCIEYNVIKNCLITGYSPELVEEYNHINFNGSQYLTASGEWVDLGQCVAVDPEIIPLYAKVIIEDKIYTALDLGVSGNVVDIMMSTEEALNFGVYYADIIWYIEN